MKLGIVGGRDFYNYSLLKSVLDKHLQEINMIVSGGATGADFLAYRYAIEKGINFVCFPPLHQDIDNVGFSEACKKRNQRIVDASDAIVAFPTPESKGTWVTINLAKKAGKKVVVI